MVRSYRKYEFSSSFGLIYSPTSNVVWTRDAFSGASARSTGAGRAYVGANEEVLCWDVKKGQLLSRWRDGDCRAEVTAIAQCAVQQDLFAVGYADGSIRIWDALSGNVIISFNGHRSAITHLVFDLAGSRLASGARDTDIIIWNLLSEAAEFRLRGHKDQITGLRFIQTRRSYTQSPRTDDAVEVAAEDGNVGENYLLSTSKDSLIKIWDIVTPHCIETHVAQTNGECWALAVAPDGNACITAGNDGELKVWSLDTKSLNERAGDDKNSKYLQSQGILHRQGKDRTLSINFHPRLDYIAVHGSEKAVELWRIRSAEEVQKSLARKRKRKREKAAAAGDPPLHEEESVGIANVSDVFVPYVVVRTGGKIRSVDWVGHRGSKTMQVLAATANNQLEVYSVDATTRAKKTASAEAPEYSRIISVDLPGHRTDVRSLALSSDDRMLASASAGALKIWNLKTRNCLRTLECGVSLCCSFLPGDKIVLVGTKTGEIELYDIASSALIETVQAHEGAIWTLQVHPDGKSVVTGSADKTAKFWTFDVVLEEIPGTRRTSPRLKLKQTRVLKVADDVLSICFSPDKRLIALSTLDNTVKVFFTDSLKLFLTLYGHKLPVLNMSISSDSKLIATCSADKNVRIWGLDFGDCHKAFFAHQDSVMQVSFIPHPVEKDEQHLFFSASKDHVLKLWDGDKFEQVQKLEGHHGEIWAMAVSRTGETVVTASHDKSIRVWEIGDDLIFLEEEREKELEEMYEATLATQLDKDQDHDENAEGSHTEVAAASKQTIATLTYGEKVLEALEVAYADLLLMRDWEAQRVTNTSLAPPQRNPLFLALGNVSAEHHVLSTLQKVPAAALHDALLVLPFSSLTTLFTFLSVFMQNRTNPELAWRVFYFLLQSHNSQIVASRELKATMRQMLRSWESWVEDEKGRVGFNLAALVWLGRGIRSREEVTRGIVEEDDVDEKVQRGMKKRVFANIA
ncbi:beta transducin [Elasticomyces elasticus]|nr:beta transducin [Elasticomyces elasticus]